MVYRSKTKYSTIHGLPWCLCLVLIVGLLIIPLWNTAVYGQESDTGTELSHEPVNARLSAGLLHSAMINYDGQLLMWGDNTYGQLGTDAVDYSDTPLAVALPRPATSVSLGAYHTLVVLDDGSVYAFGRNAFGQLGNGTTDNSSMPVQVTGLPAIKEVSAGSYHSLALDIYGCVWAWGNNSQLQIGDVAAEEIRDAGGQVLGSRCTLPVRIIFSSAIAIAAGGSHSLYLRKDGFVYAWGDNNFGQLGDGTTQSRAKPVQIPGLSSVIAIAAGYQHNLAICRFEGHDALMAWGDDSLGQLGIGSNPADKIIRTLPERVDTTGDLMPENDLIVAIQTGYAQSSAIVPLINEDGTVDSGRERLLVWGANSSGQLGLGGTDSRNTPTPIGGTFNQWTGDHFLPFDAVALGGYHMLVLSSKGILGAAGRGDRGQLGNLSVLDRYRLVPVGTPDVIRPAWPEQNRISLVYNKNMDLVVRWPAAQDNRTVAGYKLKLFGSNGQSAEIDVGNTLVQVIREALPSVAYQVTILAYDQDSFQAEETTLSRLTGFILPDSAPAGSVPEDYLDNPELSVHQVIIWPHHWQPDPEGLIRPLEMPWDIGSIYGDSALALPADWRLFRATAFTSGLLLILSFAVLLSSRKSRRRLVRKIRLRRLSPAETGGQ